jgi:hypothetical protein
MPTFLYLPEPSLPIIQEQQHQAHLALPHTGFCCHDGLPACPDLHPMVKRVIAERAMRWAQSEDLRRTGA